MKREFAILGIIIGVAVGFIAGWFIPGLFYIPTTRVPLTDTITSNGYFIVGTSADYPPFENKTYPGGLIVGFDIDVSQLIADRLGVTLNMVDMDFDSLIGACRAGTIDMIAAALTYNPTRAAQLAASITYITVRQVVIVKNSSLLTTISSLDELGGTTIGCQTGTVMETELNAVGNITVVSLPRADLLLAELVADNIDGAYVDGPIFDVWAALEDLRLIYTSDEEPLALWTRHGEPELLYEINDVILTSFQDGSMDDLVNLWFGNVTT